LKNKATAAQAKFQGEKKMSKEDCRIDKDRHTIDRYSLHVIQASGNHKGEHELLLKVCALSRLLATFDHEAKPMKHRWARGARALSPMRRAGSPRPGRLSFSTVRRSTRRI